MDTLSIRITGLALPTVLAFALPPAPHPRSCGRRHDRLRGDPDVRVSVPRSRPVWTKASGPLTARTAFAPSSSRARVLRFCTLHSFAYSRYEHAIPGAELL